MLTQDTVTHWERLFEIAQANTSAKWVRREGQSPATAPIAKSLEKISSEEEILVLIYKDTNRHLQEPKFGSGRDFRRLFQLIPSAHL
jgi:hypothetical protein